MGFLNGWKSVLGYVGVTIVEGGIIDAVASAATNPTIENIGRALTHFLLTFGLAHKVLKERF
jgi:hypothetical protein